MNPIELASSIDERYQRYLKTAFYFRDRMLRDSFEQALRDVGHLSKGPYLEATPVFKRGRTTRVLFQSLLGRTLPDSFLNAVQVRGSLYQHQEDAIRRVHEGRNVVVATGTGSGKTEAFLFPILLHLYEEFSRGELDAGVRALILYPMNALANDQRERLGEICTALKNNSSPFQFTFGQYTGGTPENENDFFRNAQTHMRERYAGELVLRTEMRRTPPHILLTNYSMLEYLLLRPEDSELFDNGRARKWTFLVMDEAHQYRGSKGIEMGMLLRRLKRRLKEGGQEGEFRCIATSASIAGSKENRKDVAKFAAVLFGEDKFCEEDVILGETELLPEEGSLRFPTSSYTVLHHALENPSSETRSQVSKMTVDFGLPFQADDDMTMEVGHILKQDSRATNLRRQITSAPVEVQAIADEIFADLPDQQRVSALSELVELLLKATDPISGAPLLSARYHLFLRALEGAFVAYWPDKKVLLDRQVSTQGGAAFEVALCRECGQHYFVGRVKDGRLQEAIRDAGHDEFGADFFRPIENQVEESDDDDDNGPKTKQTFQLCVQCGEIWPAKLGLNGGRCDHKNSIVVVKENPDPEERPDGREDQLPKCSACGYQGPDPVREVIHGTDGPHAVIATTLHQNLPANRRKVLAFADGRQEAAFFAWYLQKSYEEIRDRNFILRAVRKLAPHTTEGLSLHEVVTGIRDLYRDLHVFEASMGEIDLMRKAWLAVYREFLTDEPRIALDGVGLLNWSIKWPERFRIPNMLLIPPWSLSEGEARDLLVILFGFLRRERAVELRTEDPISINWEELNLQARQVSIQLIKSRGGKAISSWAGKTTARTGFLKKILLSTNQSEQEAAEGADYALRTVWEAVRQWDEQYTSNGRLLIRVGDTHRLNPDWWRVLPIGRDESLFQCDTCGRLQKISIKGICPRHKCPGKLKEVHLSDLGENHYRLLYDEALPARLIVEEHTAQIDKERAREFQIAFKNNKIDVLSCSTTFELGVDLGDLDTIFLRNMPPEAFNYAQRVGRAGRRKGFPGVAITYCKRAPHDLYHFAHPEQMLAGKTRPPVISLQNEKIILRHVTATALSRFFRAYPARFKSVGTLLKNIEQPSGIADFGEFIRIQRAELEDSLYEIIPQEMAKKMGLYDGAWIKNISGVESRFSLAETEVSSDYKLVKKAEELAVQMRDYKDAKWASDRADTIAGDEVLSFLSRKAVIPKYGFPVDVVELDTHPINHSRESLEVSLQRDLAIAIAEFAPTSKLVANKKEWESKGLKKVAGKEWPKKLYMRCLRHNFFKQWEKGAEPPEKCCDHAILGEYIDPIFGFVTAKGKPEEPKRRPPKTFTTRPYFVGFSGAEPTESSFRGIQITKTSPGTMVVLCEGRRGEGFGICAVCGAGFRQNDKKMLRGHKTPLGADCFGGTIQPNLSLGHEFPTDVLRMQFLIQPLLSDMEPTWFAYSLAYAIVEGAAAILEVPTSDLNATVAYGSNKSIVPPIILYDNVPGGAGLVARLEDRDILRNTLESALERVNGNCKCGEDTSCYGCLRSYRNQFAHQYLKRGPVMNYLQTILENLEKNSPRPDN